MSVSEQEVKNQIAAMEEDLDSIRTSARIGSWVRILGVLAGFGIVGLFVWAFISLGMNVYNDMEPALRTEADRIKNNLTGDPKQFQALAEEVGKAYLEEAKAMVEDMDLQTTAQEEFQAFVEDVRPIVESEYKRLSPQIEGMLQSQGQLLLDDLQAMVDEALNERLAGILASQQVTLEQAVGTDDPDEVIQRVRSAAEKAAQAMVARRWDRYADQRRQIADLVGRIPDLPRDLGEEELVSELTKALLARLKLEIPDYEL